MKNQKKILVIIFMSLLVFFTVTLKADSGWDGSYDSGGSSSWNSGSSWSGSSGGGSYSGTSNPVVSIIIIIVFVYIVYKSMVNDKNKKQVKSNISFKESPLKIEVIKEILPDFDKN